MVTMDQRAHTPAQVPRVTQWDIRDIELTASNGHDWWEFPVEATFTHSSRAQITLKGFWNGDLTWVIRFAPTLAGEWRYITSSSDPGLDGSSGLIHAQVPSQEQVALNPNYHGHIRIHPEGRYLQYDDGIPFFWLGDTVWAANTSRCGLGENRDGPFYRYLADRKAKAITLIQIECMRGFGDTTTEPAGQKNEGGYPFVANDVRQLNSPYFQSLDRRVQAIWAGGFVIAAPPTWWGKMGNCFFPLEWARRISAYLMVRYGAYNIIWSVSGEYQYVFADCGWSAGDINELASEVQLHNVYGHPVSIHPSGRTDWNPPHNVQSSRPFHGQTWHDHNWLQTGQRKEGLANVARRPLENYALTSVKPVVHAEGYYERATDPDHAYHSRWQAWCAYLNGALAGHTYGACGMWQFYDPGDAGGETGKYSPEVVPWMQALAFEGSNQLRYVRQLLESVTWWRLVPCRNRLVVDGRENPLPTDSDITAPHCAAVPGELYIVYIPRGNGGTPIGIAGLTEQKYEAQWVDPRSGRRIPIDCPPCGASRWTLPNLPEPQDEDWVCVLTREE